MTSAKGYRLKINNIIELSTLLDDYRSASLRLLGKQYGTMVAKKAVEYLDKDRLGIVDLPDNPIAAACNDVRKALGRNQAGLIAPEINCCIRLHVVHDAILATFAHGSDEYRKMWENNKNVVKWGWTADEAAPGSIPENVWKLREKYWSRVQSKALAGDLQFILIDRQLPDIGWGAIWRYLPTIEQRISDAIEALHATDPTGIMKRNSGQRVRETVLRSIESEISKNSFAKSSRNKASGAKRIREEVAASKQLTPAKAHREKLEQKPFRASEIDHADIIVAADNKIFVAVPYVGLDNESRVFVQVSDKHVAFVQNGVQYGMIDNVQRSNLDLLKTTKQVILVEIEKNFDERLLRAKHIAIVSDISLMDGLGSTITRVGDYFTTPRQEKELKEWERQQ